jgi:hypothetical protein
MTIVGLALGFDFPFFPLQTLEQFENDGCDNCEPFLNLRNHRENVYDCTSSSFDGSVILKRK